MKNTPGERKYSLKFATDKYSYLIEGFPTVSKMKILFLQQEIQLKLLNQSFKYPFCKQNSRQRPYHVENTGSRPITEVKQRRA